jgi:drug/metabolite transporter (DMT)-like permease
MVLMLLGEICNLIAYAFSPAILVAPLGALSVVIAAFLSSWFLKERLSFSGKIGCMICVLGAVIVAMHGPVANSTNTIPEFVSYVVQPGFISYAAICFLAVLFLITWVAPRYGNTSPLVFISICSIVGSFVVVGAQGLGSAIVYSASNPADSQWGYWFMYFLIGFIISCGIIQINYLNKALNIFSTAIVTPIYYVMFTTLTLICSGILLRITSFSSVTSFVTLCIGFLVIVCGVALLFEYSLKLNKIEELAKKKALDEECRRTSDEDLERAASLLGGSRPPSSSSSVKRGEEDVIRIT